MKYLFYIITFYFFYFPIYAQGNYRINFGVSPSIGFGRFESGKVLKDDYGIISNKTYIEPVITTENPAPFTNSSFENFTRKFNFTLTLEKFISDNFSISGGLEAGARRFKVQEDLPFGLPFSTHTIAHRSYRNYSIPFFITHYTRFSEDWSLKKQIFISANMANSINQDLFFYKVVNTNAIYPLVGAGLGISRAIGKKGESISFDISYHQGFYNVLNDKLFYEVYYPEPDMQSWDMADVQSLGSHFRFGLSYSFREFYIGKKGKQYKARKKYKNDFEGFKARPTGEIQTIEVDSLMIKLCVKDEQEIDGDRISIEYNDSLIFNDVSLLKEEKCIILNVKEYAPNYFVVHALNEGRISPNTVSVIVYTGKEEKIVNVKSELRKSGVINIIYKPKNK